LRASQTQPRRSTSHPDPDRDLVQPPDSLQRRPTRGTPSNASSCTISSHHEQGQPTPAPVAASAPAAHHILCATEPDRGRGRAWLWRKCACCVRRLHSASSRRPGACFACVCCAKHVLSADCERSVPTHSLSEQQCLLQPISSLWLCNACAALFGDSLIASL
jgi:hypothetical protein